MKVAETIASWSKDPSTKVGAVIVSPQGQILSTGYNGFPRGIEDSKDRLENRDSKYHYTVHAEMNAIYNAGATGVNLTNSSLFVWPIPVCSECAKGVIQSGIKNVFVCNPKEMKVSSDTFIRWVERWEQSKLMFDEAGIFWYEF